jgi:hypothetical protein
MSRGRGTFGERVDGQLPLRALGQVLQRDFGLPLAYHQVHNDEALEHNCPRRVAQAVRQGAEYLGDTCLTRVRRDEDVFDILRFGGGELQTSADAGKAILCARTLILVPPLTLFSKELAMGHGSLVLWRRAMSGATWQYRRRIGRGYQWSAAA